MGKQKGEGGKKEHRGGEKENRNQGAWAFFPLFAALLSRTVPAKQQMLTIPQLWAGKTWFQFPVPTWRLTTVCDPSSDASFWPSQTLTQAKHPCT